MNKIIFIVFLAISSSVCPYFASSQTTESLYDTLGSQSTANLQTSLVGQTYNSVSTQNVAAQQQRNSDNDITNEVQKLAHALYYINKYYLDTVNFTSLTDEAVSSMMKRLDPHSSFISAKDVKAMNEPLLGNFDGIGIEFAIINDTLSVQNVIVGGPSEKVGLRVGDKIVLVDGKEISGSDLDIKKVHGYLRGEKGSKVNLGVVRRGVIGVLNFLITRDKIPLNSIDAHYVTDDNILYVRLARFSATSYNEFMVILGKLDKMPSGIVLDLRGNAGGYLSAALQITNEFLSEGEVILYTEGLRVPKMIDKADGRGVLQGVSTAVLIDENSASASEILSGALQDWDRATIIGRRSFGKGLVQQPIELVDGSQMRLTVARYHTPTGRVIQSPYNMGRSDEYFKNIIERYKRGEHFNKDSIQLADSLKYKTLRLGRTVYGGGGIMPDIFIPADTSHYSKYYANLIRNDIFTDYMNQYLDNNRDEIKSKYKSYNDFVDNYIISDKLISDIIAYASEKGVEYNDDEFGKSEKQIRRYIKGLIVRSIFGFSDFIKYLNVDDIEVQKAFDILKQ